MIQKQHHNWEDIAQFAWNIRKRVLETAVSQGGGYLSQACSSAEILAVLYGSLLRLGPSLGSRIPSPFRGVPGRNADYVNGGVYHVLRHQTLIALLYRRLITLRQSTRHSQKQTD